MDTLETLVQEMDDLYESILGPFPYRDLGNLRRITKKKWIGLNPDLDYYWSTIAGYGSVNLKALRRRWTIERMQQAKRDCTQNFFEQHPRYLPLRRLIIPRLTPDLYFQITQYECLREKILEFVSVLENEQAETPLELLKVA